MLRLLCVCLGCTTLITAISISSNIYMFMDVSSLLFVLFVPLFFTLAYHHPFDLVKAISAALKEDIIDPKTSISYQQILSTFRLTTSASGVIGSLIGFVSMLANMDDPKNIGPAMAVALLSALYAVMLSELLLAPLINRLKLHSSQSAESQTLLKPTVITLISIPLILVMFVLLIIFIPT